MKRIIALLLVCLTLVEMLPMGIHTHAQEVETLPAETVETMAATEETTLPTETVAETVPVTESTEETAPETAETIPETVPAATEETVGGGVPDAPEIPETVPEISLEEGRYQIILDGITNDPVEETEEVLVEDSEGIVLEEAAAAGTAYESEPNDTFSQADYYSVNYDMLGTLSGYDLDYFYFRLSAKSKISIIAVATNKSFAIALLDSNGEIILKDIKGTKNDAGNYTYKIAGTYSAGKYGVLTIDGEQNKTTYGFGILVEPLYETCKHSNKKKQEVIEATCGTDGYTLYYCPTCEYTWKDKIVPATGNHVYDDDFDTYCNGCGQYRSVGIASGTCGDDLKWRITNSGELRIAGTGPMYDYIVDAGGNGSKAPWNSYKDDITSVVVEYGTTRIGNAAFYNLKQVISVSLPDTVTSIGNRAFFYCEKLGSVEIPEGVKSIERSTFNSCEKLTSVTLPQSLTSIDTLAFFGCHLLKDLTFPESLQTIGSEAFSYCNKLTVVQIPKNVSSIGSTAFESCDLLREIRVDPENGYYSSDSLGNLYDKGKTVLICVPENLAGFVDIPDTVTRINATFNNRQRVTGVTIPEGITSIPASFFAYCSALASVTLPSTLTSIGAEAFMFCRPMTSLVIPENVTSIGVEAFYCCEGLTSITFNGSAPFIEENAFYEVTSPVYYPAGDSTWTSSKRQNYGGTLTWVAACIGGHVEIIDTPGVAPTCLEAGLSPDSHCSNCGEITSVQQEIPALGHDVVTDAYLAPTCLETGLTEGSHCVRCDLTLVSQDVIPSLGHDVVVDAYRAPLCEETGLTKGSHCGRCGEVFVAQTVIPALGHAYTNHWCDHCGRAEFVEVVSITSDKLTLAAGEQAVLTAVLDYPIRPETEILWTLAEEDEAYAALEPGRETAVLTGKRLMEEKTVTVYARTADGMYPAAAVSVTIGALPADHALFSNQSVTIKPIDPATGKAYAAKELTWSMDEKYEPFIKLAKGKVTAQKVVETVRTEVVATVMATGEEIPFVIDVYPTVTLVQVRQGEEIVNGKTLTMDYSAQPITLKVDSYPLDTLENVTWTISDKKARFADYAIDGDSLTISNPKGNAGTVTIKATVSAGVKKSVTVKISFGSFAREVAMTKPGTTTLRGGASVTLSAWVSKPAVVTKPGVVWTVSDKTAATVSNGKVTAKNVAHPTTVTVTATSKDGQASASVELRIIPKDEGKLVLMCGGDYITGGTKAMNYGETCQMEAYTIVNGDPVPEQVTWSSTKASVAHVVRGEVTATGVGSAKLTATAADGRTATVTVKVATLVADMRIITKDGKNIFEENGERTVLLASGKSVNLVADILTTGANKAVTWTITEGEEYIKLANGKVTANPDMTGIAYAVVKATAKDGSGTSAAIRVKIVPLATGVQIYESGIRVRSNTTYIVDMQSKPVIRLNARVYPAKASQNVEITSSNKKVAEYDKETGELKCHKTGTVTITAKALDGSNAKTTFKLTIVKKVKSLSLKEGANLTVVGGKSLKLATMVQINPTDATNKKLKWSVAPNDCGAKISTSGVLTTKKVTQPVTVNIMVTTNDDSGCMLSFDVTIYPA